MIRSFACKDTQRLFDGVRVLRFVSIEAVVLRKLAMLAAAAHPEDLRKPPGNRLELLRGKRAGQYSIRVNDQWRICFIWSSRGAEQVEITDYH